MSAEPAETPARPALIVGVACGALSGTKAAIAPGGRLTVGRNDRAELPIPGDQKLLALHFELAWDGSACRLRTLEAAGEVRVDGRLVTEAVLADRAWIRAGGTDFVLRVEGGYERPARRPRRDDDLGPEARAERALAAQAGERERASRAKVAAEFALVLREERLFAVLDIARDERILELCRVYRDASRSLFDGVMADAMASVAPQVVRFEPGSRLLERLVMEGWGRRWGIFLTSTEPLKDVRRNLRRFLVVEDDRNGEQFYFRFYDPEVLRIFLPTCLPGQAAELFRDVDAFLFEGEDGALLRRNKGDALPESPEETPS